MSEHRDLVQEILAELEACQPDPTARTWRVHIDPALPNPDALTERLKYVFTVEATLDGGPVAVVFDKDVRELVAIALAATHLPQSVAPFRARSGA